MNRIIVMKHEPIAELKVLGLSDDKIDEISKGGDITHCLSFLDKNQWEAAERILMKVKIGADTETVINLTYFL